MVGLLAMGAWAWIFHKRTGTGGAVVESGTAPGWTAAQQQYEKPDTPVQPPAPTPVDMTAAELARIKAMLAQMQAELDALKNRKPPAATVVQPQAQKTEPPRKVPGGMLFVAHDIKPGAAPPLANEYVLAPGSTVLPCVLVTAVNSDVEGYLTCRIYNNIYDTATGRHLLIAQGSTVLGHDQSQQLLYGNERLNTISLTLALPDGRSVDLGHAPITDQTGAAGLSGETNNHWWRLFGAVFIGGALRGGTQALSTALAQEAGVGQVAAGYNSVINQATSPRLGRALDTRPTITIESGSLANIILLKPLSLPAMWE
jgi:type IV secretory pathway VirB10-like protein